MRGHISFFRHFWQVVLGVALERPPKAPARNMAAGERKKAQAGIDGGLDQGRVAVTCGARR